MYKRIKIYLVAFLFTQLLTSCVADHFTGIWSTLFYGILIVAGLGVIGFLASEMPSKEHSEEFYVDGIRHVFRDPSKDEYDIDGGGTGCATYVVAIVCYLCLLYLIVVYLRDHFEIFHNLLVIIIISIAYLGLCYWIHRYIHKVWQCVLYACWGLTATWLLVELVVLLWNTAV